MTDMDSSYYIDAFNKFKQYYLANGGNDDAFIEFRFERLFSIGKKDDFEGILKWYKEQCEECSMVVEHIPLEACKNWDFDNSSGSLTHSSGEFFKVDGIRVNNSSTREVTGGWDQPILTQVGYDGGILGLVRKRFSNVPYYLIEAKVEPGNYNLVQISTTVQATFSNLKRAHKGNSTPYSEYFLQPKKMGAKILFDQWMSEDGGRLFNKRNRSMIVEVPENYDIGLYADRYRWVTLNQLVRLTATQNAIVAPHIRGILAGI